MWEFDAFDVVHWIPVESIVKSTGIQCIASDSRWKGGFINYEIAILSVMLLPKLVTFWAILGFKVPITIYFRWQVRLIINYILHFSEPRQKVKKFVLKIRSPTKRASNSFILDKSRTTLLESWGDGTSKWFVGNPIKMLEPMPMDPKVKNYVNLEWILVTPRRLEYYSLYLQSPKEKGKCN